jgi:hypothetical protein
MQQRQLLDFLVRGEQVAFDAVGEELQRALAFVAGHHALALLAQALRDPLRQRIALDGLDLDARAVVLQRREPGAGARGLVQPRQHHERERAVVAGRGLGHLLQRGAAVLAGLARGDADLDDLLVGEQRERAARRQHRAPVEVRAGHGVRAALGVALRARGRANGVGRLLCEQRLVAVDGVERLQPLLQVGPELGAGKLHGNEMTGARGLRVP